MTSSYLPSSHVDNFTRDNLPPDDQLPVFIFDRPEVQYPELINAGTELVDHNVLRGFGKNFAIHGRGINGEKSSWTYDELLIKVDQIAHVLTKDMGLVPGNRVLLRGANSPMMAACLLATLKAGIVAVPTMPLLRAVELQQVIDKAQITAVICDELLASEITICTDEKSEYFSPLLKEVVMFRSEAANGLETRMQQYQEPFKAHPTTRDDVCLIAFTSGTTGKPKGTMHFHRDILAMCDLFPKYILKMKSEDVVCGTPPIAFTFGLGGLLTFPLRYGASTVLVEKLTPEALLQTIQDFNATQCYTAPTFYRQMAPLADKYNLSSLKHPVAAGEALPDATRQLWKSATGLEITDGIGGTEMIHIYISSAGKDIKRGAIGKVIPGYIAQIVDENLNPVPPGMLGKLAVRGPTGCRYLADSRQTDYVKDGWNFPGDTFIMDEDGYFSYQARNDDMIISAGYNIAGPEVEDILLKHPAVAECGVIGAPDAERGQIVHAFIVLKADHSGNADLVKELQNFVKDSIAPFKYPRQITFLQALPRTETGKLQRFKLRQSINN
jgi:2-aminobenzoate-CoA ligase